MAASSELKDAVSQLVVRLLSGPVRPGQAFTMPGCNYDGLYLMARRFKAFFDGNNDDAAPVCLCSDDRAVMAAALLASLAGGPELLMPHALSGASLSELHQVIGYTKAIGEPTDLLPPGVTVIEPQALTDEVETLTSDEALDPDRLAVSARVVADTPSFPEEIKQQMDDTSPTIFVSVPIHYRTLKDNPPDKGALRLAFSSAGPLAEADGMAFFNATGVDLVEVYGSTETGGIATRCRAKGEEDLTPFSCIQWRVAGADLDIRSPFLSGELSVRESGWFTASDRVKAHGNGGFVVTGRSDNI
ncbi:MAG: AMP-binding protein, partial [Desulfosarcina sp.]|nr:AMP-binding protein [Desulfosarcina sp.]MBC2768292.1 long-chain fatty acid--CoA ligase [Desulfosarcina sp.]